MTDARLLFSLPLRFAGAAIAGGSTGALLCFAWFVAASLLAGEPLAPGLFAPLFTAAVLFGSAGAAIAIPLYGVPVMFVLSAAGAECLAAYAAAGAAGGYLGIAFLDGADPPLLRVAGALYGAATAGWFWFIFRRPGGAPDGGA